MRHTLKTIAEEANRPTVGTNVGVTLDITAHAYLFAAAFIAIAMLRAHCCALSAIFRLYTRRLHTRYAMPCSAFSWFAIICRYLRFILMPPLVDVCFRAAVERPITRYATLLSASYAMLALPLILMPPRRHAAIAAMFDAVAMLLAA